MDKDTIREICDVVNDEVMRNVDFRLENAIEKLVTTIRQLQSKNVELEERIKCLEAVKCNSTSAQAASCDGIQKTMQGSSKAVDGITVLSSEQMDDILSLPKFYHKGNGWIYYINNEGLFKVHPNGTDNQKIYPGKVATEEAFMYFFKLEGNMISFMDAELRTRTIKV